MVLDFIIIIFVVRYLRKTYNTAVDLPKWDKTFNSIFYGSIVFLCLSLVFKEQRSAFNWLAHAVLLYIVYVLYSQPEFAKARSYMLAIAPYILVAIVADIIKQSLPRFYESYNSYVETAVLFSIIWLIAMLVINRRQQKALETEKLKTKEEEEQNKIMARVKDELEVQVRERTAQLTKQKEELQLALNELKATQSQLVHSEKMASLGELTAGIAHEIQNPLNFVNNFSDVNSELIEEMKTELAAGNNSGAIEIANDIADNEQKIKHHGRRAEAIVKGMLQHSRSSSGAKEPTDINALADEYLRLAYHGLRAKDKTFNATIATHFDETVGEVEVIPQDIGRCILNLITNAFYAVTDRKKESPASYEPTVTVETKRLDRKIEIRVKDNGNGISPKVLDKIFQPFFTTKPTGQGTGLGLSLTYDIITKGHQGDVKVETKENEGTTFILVLPSLR